MIVLKHNLLKASELILLKLKYMFVSFSYTCSVLLIHSLAVLCYKGDTLLSISFAIVNSVPWMGSSLIFFIANRIDQFSRHYITPLKAFGVATAIPCQ